MPMLAVSTEHAAWIVEALRAQAYAIRRNEDHQDGEVVARRASGREELARYVESAARSQAGAPLLDRVEVR